MTSTGINHQQYAVAVVIDNKPALMILGDIPVAQIIKEDLPLSASCLPTAYTISDTSLQCPTTNSPSIVQSTDDCFLKDETLPSSTTAGIELSSSPATKTIDIFGEDLSKKKTRRRRRRRRRMVIGGMGGFVLGSAIAGPLGGIVLTAGAVGATRAFSKRAERKKDARILAAEHDILVVPTATLVIVS